MSKKKVIIVTACILLAIGILVCLGVTYREDVSIKGKHIAYLIDRDTEEVVQTMDVEIDGRAPAGNYEDFRGDICLLSYIISLQDLKKTDNGKYYDTDNCRYDDSKFFSYPYAYTLAKDKDFSTYVIGLSEEYSEHYYKYCFVCNAADENEALEIYKEMKSDIEQCYSLIGADMDSYTYQGIVRDADGNEIDRKDVTINGLYYLSNEKAHRFYGELLVEGYYESGINEDTFLTTEYTSEVVFTLKNEEGIVAEIHGNPFDGENINIIIKTSEDGKQTTLYEIECNKN